MESVKRSNAVKKTTALALGAVIFMAIAALGFRYLETQRTLNSTYTKFIQTDKTQQILSRLSSKGVNNFTDSDLKSYQAAMKQTKSDASGLASKQVIQKLQSYLVGRGSPRSLEAKWRHLRSTVQDAVNFFKTEGFKSANEMEEIAKIFNATAITENTASYSSDVRAKLSVLLNRFNKVSMDDGKRQQALNMLNKIDSTFSEIEARTNFKLNNVATVKAFEQLLSQGQNAMADFSSIYAASIRLHQEQLKDLTYYLIGLALTMSAMLFLMQFRNEKIVVKETIKEVVAPVSNNNENNFSNNVNAVFQHFMDVATVILNSSDEVIWASDSFYQLAGNLDKNKNYNWNDLLKSEIVTMGGVHHIKGAVKIKSRPNENYQMKSKTMSGGSNHLKDARLIQLIPLLSYQTEINKELMQFESIKGVTKPKLYELGDLIEESAKKMANKFGKNNVVFNESNPIYVAVEKEDFVSAMDTLLTGLMLYGENTFNSGNVKINQDREGDVNTIVFAYHQTKFDNVSTPMSFRGKTYPSLSAYMAKLEDQLAKYQAEINLKNIYQKNGQLQEGRLEVRFREQMEVIKDAAALPQKERVARAVNAAKRANQAQDKLQDKQQGKQVVANVTTEKRYSVKEFN
jgi:hypothetical protein